MDIASFASKISSGGVQKSSHYQVEFFPPGGVGQVPYGNSTAHCYVKDVSLPGRNISTSEIKYGGLPTTKQAYNSIPNDCTVTFMADGDMQLWRYFQKWQGAIHDPVSGAVGYPDEYKGIVKISTFDASGSIKHEQELEDAFPENLSDIQLSYGAEELATFSVTFSYTRLLSARNTDVARFIDAVLGGAGGVSFSVGPFSARLSI
jgi:hypothetical protein